VIFISAPKVRNKVLLAVALACSSSSSVRAGELQISPSLTASGYYYNTKNGTEPSENTEAVALIPKLVSVYGGRYATANLVVENTSVEQKSDLAGTDKNFTELSYGSSLQLLENVLTLSVTGSQSYNATTTAETLVSDKILSSGELTKTSTNGAQLAFITPNPKKVGVSIQGGYSKSSSDSTATSTTGVDSDTTYATATLYQGSDFTGMSFSLSSQYYDTTRETLQDYTTTLSSARVSFKLIDEISFVLVGSDSDYGLDETELGSQRQNLDTTSYGAGFAWQPTDDNTIEVTYNKLDENDTTTHYIGVSTQWAFSERTNFQFTYDKSFYGDAYTFDLDYKLKHFNASATYDENVTSYSRLSVTEGASSLFVCPIGSASFADCFQPSSSDYVLLAGEEYRSLNSFTTDISDETLFIRSGGISFGYDKGKLLVGLGLNYYTTEYLESDIKQTTKSTSLQVSYELSRLSTLGLYSSYSSVDYSSSQQSSDVTSLTLSLDHDLNSRMSLSVAARYVNREREEQTNDLTDSRLTVSVNYQF
jgi:uncharacterized protein (PEP-CTERM system associated)